MNIRVFFPLFLLASALAFPQAAAIDGQIEGVVRDPAGAAVSKASVKARNLGTGLERQGETNQDGYYRFSVLPRGEYEVLVASAGFNNVKQTGITIGAGTTATINIDLSIKSAVTEIVVSASGPVTEPGRTDIGSTLSANQIQVLVFASEPIKSISYRDPETLHRRASLVLRDRVRDSFENLSNSSATGVADSSVRSC